MKPRTAIFLLILAPLVLAQDPVGKAAPGVAAFFIPPKVVGQRGFEVLLVAVVLPLALEDRARQAQSLRVRGAGEIGILFQDSQRVVKGAVRRNA